jgi:hypothetical protein
MFCSFSSWCNYLVLLLTCLWTIMVCSFEFRLRVALGPKGDLLLTSRIRNTNADGRPFSFTFAYHTYLCVSDIRYVHALQFIFPPFSEFPFPDILTWNFSKGSELKLWNCVCVRLSSGIWVWITRQRCTTGAPFTTKSSRSVASSKQRKLLFSYC